MNLSPELMTLLMSLGLIIGILSGHPLAFVLGGVATISGLIGLGPGFFPIVIYRIFTLMTDWVLIAVPLFILMGSFLERTGVASGMFEAVHYLLGPIKGGMGVTVIIICTLLAACTGIVGASIVMAGLLGIEPMLKYGYQKEMVTGIVGAGGILGILIPPSLMLVFMGSQGGLSVGKLFYGAIGPGVLLAVCYILYILIRCYLNPELGPALSLEIRQKIDLKGKLKLAFFSLLPPLILILSVLGVILAGIASPTEAAGIGALVALLMTICYRKLNWQNFKEIIINTGRTTSMAILIAVGGSCFSSVFLAVGGGGVINRLFERLSLGPWGTLAVIMSIVFLMGFLIDWVAIIFITFPIFLPIVKQSGFDSLWFVVLVAVILQTCFLTPPFGYALFYIKAILPEGVTIKHVYMGVIPFVLIILACVVLCTMVPQIILWMPENLIS